VFGVIVVVVVVEGTAVVVEVLNHASIWMMLIGGHVELSLHSVVLSVIGGH
jgi:hypothetical protein